MEATFKASVVRALFGTDDKSAYLAEYHLNVGNILFNKLKFTKASLEYNAAIRYALPKSQTLGLAYLNRAVINIGWEKYAECLKNIQWARESNPSDSVVIRRLNHMEKMCRNGIELSLTGQELEVSRRLTEPKLISTDQEFNPWGFFKLSRPANDKIPFIINE